MSSDLCKRRDIAMLTCRVAIVTLVLVVGSAIGVAVQEAEVSPSVPASPAGESATPAPTWLDEQTCIGLDFPGAMSAKGKSVGDLFNCAKALGHREAGRPLGRPRRR
jgi:hypothetical protein